MSKNRLETALGVALTVTLAACTSPDRDGSKGHVDYLEGFPTGETQRREVCERGHTDRFSQYLCAGGGPQIGGFADLLAGLWIDPATAPFAITSHSTSSIARSTTVLNPRVVFYPTPGSADPYLLIGYARGDGFAEVIAYDPGTAEPNFYFIKYELPCGRDCSNAERFGPESETGWENVSVYDDVDLHNTPLDCLMCHVPGGAGTPRILRMQELTSPWTHWFQRGQSSEVLLDQYLAAHEGESFAGIAHGDLEKSNPGVLEFFLRQTGNGTQPNEFPSGLIEEEGERGPVWQSLFAQARAGEAISVPYWGVSPFDPAKVADASSRYRAIRSGQRPASDMPDLTDLFLESAKPDLGFTAANEATTGTAVVLHRCGTCHNGKFPGISRNNFDVHDYPDALSPSMKEKVLERIRLPATDPERMPPILFSELTEAHLQMIEADLAP